MKSNNIKKWDRVEMIVREINNLLDKIWHNHKIKRNSNIKILMTQIKMITNKEEEDDMRDIYFIILIL